MDRMKIREFLSGLLREHDDHAGFDDAESLIESGRLDSLAVVNLAVFLESASGVDFGRVEFDPQRLGSVDEIAAVIEESRRAVSAR
jgi:acyl carrier protein